MKHHGNTLTQQWDRRHSGRPERSETNGQRRLVWLNKKQREIDFSFLLLQMSRDDSRAALERNDLQKSSGQRFWLAWSSVCLILLWRFQWTLLQWVSSFRIQNAFPCFQKCFWMSDVVVITSFRNRGWRMFLPTTNSLLLLDSKMSSMKKKQPIPCQEMLIALAVFGMHQRSDICSLKKRSVWMMISPNLQRFYWLWLSVSLLCRGNVSCVSQGAPVELKIFGGVSIKK